MSQETSVILKQLLLQITKAKTLDEAKDAINFLCTKEDIAEAERLAAKEAQNKQ